MGNPRKPSSDDFDEIDLFAEQDLDLDKFLDSMEKENKPGRKKRAAWQRLDELLDQRRLKAQLDDWDWE